MRTSLSVAVRILLWCIMLFGGPWYALIHDWDTALFRNVWFHLLSAIMGSLVLLLSFRAAGNGGRELTKGRVGDIPRLEINTLVTTGLYSCMRHPMLFGLTLLPMGWALLLGSPTFITQVAPFEMLFIILMVIVFEEMEVKQKFGEAYDNYSQNVSMVSFRKECLRQLFKKGV